MSISGDEKRLQICDKLRTSTIEHSYAYNNRMARAAMKRSDIQKQAIKKNQDFTKMYETVKRYSKYNKGAIFMMLKKECSIEVKTWFDNVDDVMDYINLTLKRLERDRNGER